MAIRIGPPLLILKKSIRSTLLISLFVSIFLVALAIQIVFARLEADQSQHIATVLSSLLRNESSMSQSYLIAQSLEDMQTNGAIRCAHVTKFDRGQSSVFYDSTYKSNCPAQHLTKIEMQGLDGHQWILQVLPNLSISFYIIKWSITATSIVLLCLMFKVLCGIFERDQKRIEAEATKRRFMEQLTEQVRHDVASPISALRMIAEKAPLDPDTKAFLKEAVSRTSGIFQTLKDVSQKPEPVNLASEIRMIIEEKKLSGSSFPTTSINIDGVHLYLNKTEFCRMISNLLDNSHEAEATSIDITAKPGPGFVHLVISDNGKPIPESVLSKLGERGNTLGKINGTGLGLFQSHRFMRSIGGRLTANAQGAKLLLEFPNSSTY